MSQFSRSNDPGYNPLQEPLNDADELQPVTIPEGGRTQQMWINFKTPAQAVPGLYEGSIRIFADGKEAGVLKVQVRILPFELPEAKTYYDSNRNFISWLTGTTNGPESYAEKQLKFLSGFVYPFVNLICLNSLFFLPSFLITPHLKLNHK